MAKNKTVATTTMMNPKYAPSASGARHPESTSKQNNGTWNWPRYQFFGGAQQPFSQAGDKMLYNVEPKSGQNAVGPISDRGKGRG